MRRFRLGCQTITWGEGQRDILPDVFAQAAAAGYAGLEIGFRHIQHLPPETLTAQLAEHGLTLFATHIGGNLEDAGQAGRERGLLDEVMDYLPRAGCRTLLYSGLRYQDDAQFARDLAMIRRAADRCAERGLRFLYHNHDWEFAAGGRVINALLDGGGTSLGFCPDIGWVMKGGWDVPAFLDRIGPRLRAVHFKDFAAPGAQVDTVLLGDGIAPLAEAAGWLTRNASDLWVIAEQDRAAVPAADAAAHNAAYLRRLFGTEAFA